MRLDFSVLESYGSPSADHMWSKFNSPFFERDFRSPQVIPGLWLLSLGLAGAYQRCESSLSIPIGLRAGIMASSFVLQKGGFLTYKSNFPLWVTGAHPFQPFSGVVGFAFALVMATVLYPTQPPQNKKLQRTIRE